MQDDLKRFIEANRNDFDNKEPGIKVWNTILSTLKSEKKWGIEPIRFWQAAAVIFFALSAFLYTDKFTQKESPELGSDFKNTETFYTDVISDKLTMLHASNVDVHGFTSDFQQLEAMYEVLQEEMQVRPSKKVQDAMILNLLVRINLLNKQLQEADEQTRQKKETQS
jgi:hypothetical protein